MTRFERFAIGVVVGLGGAVLMALEVSAFRIIGRTYGTALRETTTVIAVFLTAMSLGYYFGGRVVDRHPRLVTLGYTLLFASPLILATLQFEKPLTGAIAGSNAPMALHAFAASTALFSLPTVLLAAISPIAVRLLSTETGHSGRVAGAVSAISAIGSIAGTVLTAFVLIDLFGSMRITVLVLATTTLLLAAIVAAAAAARMAAIGEKRFARAPLAIGLLTAGTIAAFAIEQPASLAGTGRVLFDRETAYHHIRVVERPPGVRDLYILPNLQSNYVIGDPHLRGHPYEEYKHLAKIIRPGIRDALMIGLGGGTSPRQFTGFYPEVTVDAVEIDPVVIDVAQRFFDVQPGPRLRLHVGDGRAFLRRSRKTYDLISVDVYTRGRYGATVPPHLVTVEFLSEVSGHLNDGGIFHFHSSMAQGSPFARAMYKTIRKVFPSVITVGETEFIASATPIHLERESLTEAAKSLEARFTNFTSRLGSLTFEPPPTDDVPLLTDDYAPVDALLRRAPLTARER